MLDKPICDGLVCDFTSVKLGAVNIITKNAFMCGSILIENDSNFEVNAESLFIGNMTQLVGQPPIKAGNGKDGQRPGENGQDGQPGTNGLNMKLTLNVLLDGSSTRLEYSFPGGEGGNGGNGKAGSDAVTPKICSETVTTGEIIF